MSEHLFDLLVGNWVDTRGTTYAVIQIDSFVCRVKRCITRCTADGFGFEAESIVMLNDRWSTVAWGDDQVLDRAALRKHPVTEVRWCCKKSDYQDGTLSIVWHRRDGFDDDVRGSFAGKWYNVEFREEPVCTISHSCDECVWHGGPKLICPTSVRVVGFFILIGTRDGVFVGLLQQDQIYWSDGDTWLRSWAAVQQPEDIRLFGESRRMAVEQFQYLKLFLEMATAVDVATRSGSDDTRKLTDAFSNLTERISLNDKHQLLHDVITHALADGPVENYSPRSPSSSTAAHINGGSGENAFHTRTSVCDSSFKYLK